MKTLMHLRLVCLFFILAHAATAAESVPASPRGWEIGISPFHSPAAATNVYRQVLAFVLQEVPGGASVRCWDAWNLTTIATFQVPDLKLSSPALRARLLAAEIGRLQQWQQQAQREHASSPLAGSAAAKTPEWLLQLARENGGSALRSVVILASPLYRSPAEPTFDMGGGRYPSEGHLDCSSEQSVFGVSERQHLLRGVTIHWWHGLDAAWINEGHRHVVTRFWWLWTARQEGCLGSFSPDLPSILRSSLAAGANAALAYTPNPTDDKPVMKLVVPREVPAWMPKVLPVTPVPVAAPEPSTPPAPPTAPADAGRTRQAEPATPPAAAAPLVPPVFGAISGTPPTPAIPMVPEPPAAQPTVSFPVAPSPSKLCIGILWDAPVDLDLYVRPTKGSRELHYRLTRTAEGAYHHDYRSANAHLDHEFVELDASLDPGRVEAWVNFYKGRSPSPTGKVVVFLRGQTASAPFSLRASEGNRGGSSGSREDSPHWVRLDLSGLLKDLAQP